VKILVWVEASEKDTIINLIQQKFFGYLLNSFEMGELLQALKLFQQNKPYLQPNLSSLFLEVYINDKIQNKTLPNLILTKREWEVLQLLCTGASNEQVGNQLFLTESTVKNHVSSILSKLEVPDRTSAVVKAFKNRWVNI
jgi:two-component system, NarL family, response regulator DegU